MYESVEMMCKNVNIVYKSREKVCASLDQSISFYFHILEIGIAV